MNNFLLGPVSDRARQRLGYGDTVRDRPRLSGSYLLKSIDKHDTISGHLVKWPLVFETVLHC